MDHHTPETFSPLHETATRLGVPVDWLKAEADAGRIPVLKAGRRLMFNFEKVEQALLQRSQSKQKQPADVQRAVST